MNSLARFTPLFTAEQIERRISELAQSISQDYETLDSLVVIGVLKGAFCFLSDLVREIKTDQPLQIEFVHLSSYGNATESTGSIQAPYLNLPNILHRNILVVEDIVDSGRTANFFLEYLKDQFDPTSLRLATFLDKPSRRIVSFTPDYVGFTINDVFVVGYGLDDYGGKYRELPFVGEVRGAGLK